MLYLEFTKFITQKYPTFCVSTRSDTDVPLIKGGVGGYREDVKGSKIGENDITKDITAGIDVVSSYVNGSFMTWDEGSSLLFWRWPATSQSIARNNIPPYQLPPFLISFR